MWQLKVYNWFSLENYDKPMGLANIWKKYGCLLFVVYYIFVDRGGEPIIWRVPKEYLL
jgi:hypothetical protein